MKSILISFIVSFLLTLVVNVIVIFVYNLVAHGAGRFDWGTAVPLAIVFGFVLPLTDGWRTRRR